MTYFVFHASRAWVREIAASSNFEARRIAANACGLPVVEFASIRRDLMRPEAWAALDLAAEASGTVH